MFNTSAPQFYKDPSVTPRHIATLLGHEDRILALTFLPDGRLASGSLDATIRLWNLMNGQCETVLAGHARGILALATLLDGHLASGSWDTTIRIWDVRSKTSLKILRGHTRKVNALAVLTDGRLVSGSGDNSIHLWNVLRGVCEMRLVTLNDLHSLTVLTDGRLVSGNAGNKIQIWNVSNGLKQMTLSTSKSISIITGLKDGRLASGSSDGTIQIWNTLNGKCEATFSEHSDCVHALAALIDGRLVSGSEDKTIRLWNVENYTCEAVLLEHEDWITALTALPNGGFVSGSGRFERAICLWDAGLRQVPQTEVKGNAHAPVTRATISASLLPTLASHEFTLEREVGRGTRGVVHEGVWQGRHKITVKQLHKQNLRPEYLAEFQQEVQLLFGLRHPNLINLYGVCVEPDHYALVSEFMAQGSLYDLLHNSTPVLPWPQRFAIALDVACGLFYLHTRNISIAHGNLKSTNILVDERGQAKLSNFGLTKVKAASMLAATPPLVSTLLWKAPEVLKGEENNPLSDIYALGIILWELTTLQQPYRGKREDMIIHWVSEGKREPIPQTTPLLFSQLIQRCWAQRSEMRPHSSEVVDILTHIETTSLSEKKGKIKSYK